MDPAQGGLLEGEILRVYQSTDARRYNDVLLGSGVNRHDLTIAVPRARSWIFLESFERFFGLYTGSITKIKEEIEYIKSRPLVEQFISPLVYQQSIFDREKLGLKPVTPLPAIPTDPRELFVWYLCYELLGLFWWKEGQSDAFTGWLMEEAAEEAATGSKSSLGNSAKIRDILTVLHCCWEMVFYAAIKSGLLKGTELHQAYAFANEETPTVLTKRFQRRSKTYDLSKKDCIFPKLEAGDIIVDNNAAVFQHVFTITEPADDIGDVKIVQLWGSSGAGVTFYWHMGDFISRSPKFDVIKL